MGNILSRPRSIVSLLAALSLAGCADVGAAASSEENVIFGTDDRVDAYEVIDPALRALAIGSAPAQFVASSLDESDPLDVRPRTRPLGSSHDLCSGALFEDQPSASRCSATLVDDDLVVTAGHCVLGDSPACEDQRYVFGWYYDAPGELHPITASDVFRCRRVVMAIREGRVDVAVVQLDRAAIGHAPVPVRIEPVAIGEILSIAGYPMGLSLKVVERGDVSSIAASSYQLRIDGFPGNSGSGIFDAEHRYVGDLFAGPFATVIRGAECSTLAQVGDDHPDGEHITSVAPMIDGLCATGFPSVRLCDRAPSCGDGFCTFEETVEECARDCAPARCGDGICGEGERALCLTDCPRDAGVRDAGARDAGVTRDAAAIRDGSLALDAGTAEPRPAGCACQAGSSGPMSRATMALALALTALVRSRRARRESRHGRQP